MNVERDVSSLVSDVERVVSPIFNVILCFETVIQLRRELTYGEIIVQSSIRVELFLVYRLMHNHSGRLVHELGVRGDTRLLSDELEDKLDAFGKVWCSSTRHLD